ncbi:FAD-dependent oxidoreductase [Aurantibacter sp.]|uniref:FAD-dependent oxidoreductase n=1 Tax=Aurantibacter sp. TaxID=2807103 RepID=UPI0035C7F78A
MKVIIIGAGPAGLSCGYKLAKENVNVEIFEASPYVGGMSRSFDLWGQRVDLGPHRFFSKEKHINDFFTTLIKDDYTLVNRLTRIYYKNTFFNYPIKLFNVLRNLSIFTIFQILWDYAKVRLVPIKNPDTFEKWVSNRFGTKLYEIFFKHYSEKLWGIPCSKIDADWAAQRIKSLSLFEAVKSAFFGNIGNKHKTLIDQFAYPNYGTGTLYERAANYITEHNGQINLNKKVSNVIQDANGKAIGIELTDGTQVFADVVISTMPLTLLLKGLQNVPTQITKAVNKLYFRNTILVYLEVDALDLFKDNWIYVHSPEVKHGRITNFRNWSPTLNKDKDTTILCMEFWAFNEDEIWTDKDENISELAIKEIKTLNLIPKETKFLNSKIIRVPRCYPVYETGYQKPLKEVESYLDTIENLIPIGRYGSFKYNNQDHSILMGILAAEKITTGKHIDLWEINTDVEYQEDAKIKDVLL